MYFACDVYCTVSEGQKNISQNREILIKLDKYIVETSFDIRTGG